MDESVLRGNTAILKCHIPSFVADYVFVSSWTSDSGDEYSINENHAYGIEIKTYSYITVYSLIIRFKYLYKIRFFLILTRQGYVAVFLFCIPIFS